MNILYLSYAALSSAIVIVFIFWNRKRSVIQAKHEMLHKKLEEEKIIENNQIDKESTKNTSAIEVQITEDSPIKPSIQELAKNIKRAEILLSYGEDEEAEKVLVSTLSLDPENIDALIFLASLYLKRKQYSRAEVLYRALNDLQRNKNTGTISNLAFCLYEQNKIDEAILFYEQALELDPKNVKRYTNLGQVFFVTRDFDEAIKLFVRALRFEPRDTSILFMLADTYREAQKLGKARETYIKILDYEPYNTEAREEIVKIEARGIFQK